MDPRLFLLPHHPLFTGKWNHETVCPFPRLDLLRQKGIYAGVSVILFDGRSIRSS